MKTAEEPIVVEQTFNVAPEDLWKTVTEHERMLGWYFKEIPDFKAEIGFETRFDIECDGRVFPHRWKIVEVEPGRRIVYDWAYDGYDGRSGVSFEVSEADGGSKLTLTHKMTEDSSNDIPEFTREAGLEGWTWFICESLPNYLNKAG